MSAGAPAAPSGIRFDGVSVAYGENTVLDRLDLTAAPGATAPPLRPAAPGRRPGRGQ